MDERDFLELCKLAHYSPTNFFFELRNSHARKPGYYWIAHKIRFTLGSNCLRNSEYYPPNNLIRPKHLTRELLSKLLDFLVGLELQPPYDIFKDELLTINVDIRERQVTMRYNRTPSFTETRYILVSKETLSARAKQLNLTY